MDIVSSSVRSRMMSGIRGNNTRPEMIVRKYLHAAGLRYRLHQKQLPGTPDIVLRRFNVAILVNGCFWHRHVGCKYATTPVSNESFWQKKFLANVQRDQKNISLLIEQGWRVILVWECALRGESRKTVLESLIEDIRLGTKPFRTFG